MKVRVSRRGRDALVSLVKEVKGFRKLSEFIKEE